ncbi:hypothetical protein HBI56_227040 [Parastagonospora nodorum]|nr:hypothetical protein HBH52_216420 [Parastagonospora nodorum]KAH3991136.1 hypothetical protein HBI10_237460 [Parastagonospora nodorum]KAH4008462.1 hypothetical protein HBI13_236380 [Parastagonospora nodorum]KAH4011287.1 hypothetical protein HBI09_227510 [Parastagonospora nodorum]KAH4042476.1 hypothetical protein HBH49_249090 [Parastagonospora nodorum]
MASPQESITTVSGRRCTRSRARTAATSILTSSEAAVVTPTEVTTSSTAAQAPPVQTSPAEAAPPPPPPPPPPSSAAAAPPPSSAPAEQPAAAPTTTQSAVSSALGTQSTAPIPSAPRILLPNPAPSQQAVAPPQRPVQVSAPAPAAEAVVSSVAQVSTPVPALLAPTTLVPTVPVPTSSNAIPIAALPPSLDQSSVLPSFISPPGTAESAVLPSSLVVDANPQPTQSVSPSESTSASANEPVAAQPRPTTSVSPVSTGDAAAGVIGPAPSSESGGGLTLPTSGNANIGSIAGGVAGGVAGLVLICGLLFFCLRKRKSRQPRWAEKNLEGPRFMDKMKAKAAGVGVMFAKVKGSKKGPAKNPYQRHSQQDSISSVYSTADSQGFYAPRDVKRSSSRKSERNRLRKKNSSVSSQSTFAGILEEHERSANNPFADPEPPRLLRLSNPDAASPRGPLTPQPALTSVQPAQNPFASAFDEPNLLLSAPGHQRTQSQASALTAHPPSFVFPTNPTRRKSVPKPMLDPPPPSQASGRNQARRSSMALPTFDATSTAASGESDYFGEPGPSRPGTGMFTPGLPTGRTVRQSDPFDLDRPEVLRFGNVLGRNEVRASVTRQNTRSKRTSSAGAGNWSSVKDAAAGPFSWNVIPRR